METVNRPAHLYGKVLNYAVVLLCPKCKRKLSYCPRKIKGKLYPEIKKNATKLCFICNTRFSIRGNILGEREIKTK